MPHHSTVQTLSSTFTWTVDHSTISPSTLALHFFPACLCSLFCGHQPRISLCFPVLHCGSPNYPNLMPALSHLLSTNPQSHAWASFAAHHLPSATSSSDWCLNPLGSLPSHSPIKKQGDSLRGCLTLIRLSPGFASKWCLFVHRLSASSCWTAIPMWFLKKCSMESLRCCSYQSPVYPFSKALLIFARRIPGGSEGFIVLLPMVLGWMVVVQLHHCKQCREHILRFPVANPKQW